MQSYNVNDLPALVKNGKLSKAEAASYLWGKIYQEPGLFGLSNFTEDQKSDFLLHYHKNFERVFETYQEGKIKFFYYLKRNLELQKTTWLRKLENNYIKDQLNIDYYSSEDFCMTKDSPEELTLKRYNMQETEKLTFSLQNRSRTQKQKLITKYIVLILLLKSCNTVNDEMLSNVSKFTGLPFETLLKMLDRIKLTTEKKLKARDHLLKRRDDAFYFHRKYTASLKKAIPGTKTYNVLLHQYQSKTRLWKNHNLMLQKRYKNTPTNEAIAKELGIPARLIGVYLKKAFHKDSQFYADTLKFIKNNFH